MDLSKILKKNSIILDDTKKYTIPIPSMPPEEPEIQEDFEEIEFENYDFREFAQQSQEQGEVPTEDISEEKQPNPEPPRQEYDFEDFNFSEFPENEEDTVAKELERQREEAELAAAQMIEEAQIKSGELIRNATETAELIITHTLDGAKAELGNAISAGYSDGFETGRHEALKVVEPALNKIGILTETINRLQDKMLYEFRDSMFSMISVIAKKVVHKEIDEDNHYLVALFSDAIQDVKAEEFVTITVAESELTVATRNEKLFLAEIPHIKENHFKILPDKNETKGTMIVETEKAVVDSSIDAQLERVDYFLAMIKENLDIPKTVDDVISHTSLKNINSQAEMMLEMEAEDGYGDYSGYDENVDNIDSENMMDIDINSENEDDISDEDIMKYFSGPDFNVD